MVEGRDDYQVQEGTKNNNATGEATNRGRSTGQPAPQEGSPHSEQKKILSARLR